MDKSELIRNAIDDFSVNLKIKLFELLSTNCIAKTINCKTKILYDPHDKLATRFALYTDIEEIIDSLLKEYNLKEWIEYIRLNQVLSSKTKSKDILNRKFD